MRREEEGGRLAEVEYQLERSMLLHLEKGEGENELPTEMSVEVIVLDIPEKNGAGGEKNKTILMIGGMGEDLSVMRPVLKELALQGKQVVAISMPGYGAADNPDKSWREDESGETKKDFKDYSVLVGRIYDELRGNPPQKTARPLADKPTVVGHSLGGAIAADFASRNTDRVDSVVLVAPGGLEKEPIIPGTYVAPKMTAEFSITHFKEAFKRFAKEHEDEVPPVVRSMWVDNFLLDKNSLRLVQRFWESSVMAQGNLEEDVGKINDSGVPVTIVSSEKDSLFPTKKYDELVKRLAGENAEVKEMKGAGHYGILDDPQQFAKLME